MLNYTKNNLLKEVGASLDKRVEEFIAPRSSPRSYVMNTEMGIKVDSDKKHVICSYYNSKDNDRQNNPNPMGDSSNYATKLARRLHASGISEEQGIIYSISQWVSNFTDNYSEDIEYIVLLDEIDSGLSCDHVNVVLHLLNDNIFNRPNVQAFISSNMYHWAYTAKTVFSMYTGEFLEIPSYDGYFKIQQSNQKMVGAKSDFNFL